MIIDMTLEANKLDRHIFPTGAVDKITSCEYHALLDRVKRFCIVQVMNETGGNKCRAARILGINRNTLAHVIKSLKIKVRQC